MTLQDPDQTPQPYTSYKRVRRHRRPGLFHRIKSSWKRTSRNTKRLLFKGFIASIVSVLAILLAVLIVALQ